MKRISPTPRFPSIPFPPFELRAFYLMRSNKAKVDPVRWQASVLADVPTAAPISSDATRARDLVRSEDAESWQTRARLILTGRRSPIVVNAINHFINALFCSTLSSHTPGVVPIRAPRTSASIHVGELDGWIQRSMQEELQRTYNAECYRLDPEFGESLLG